MTQIFEHPIDVRYLEVDQQGVVFNMWYLAYFDDAMTAFLAARGLDYDDLVAAGFDVMVVHAELDWRGGVGWRDQVRVAVSPSRIGATSFTLDFQVRRERESPVDGRIVYVCVASDGGGKQVLPDMLRSALGDPAPLHGGSGS